MSEKRFYGFGNYYLSSLQQGLQAGHAVGEFVAQYDFNTEQFAQYYDWVKNHKTMVLLNGGNSAMLASLYQSFQDLEALGMPYPYVKFHEDEVSLNGALTYVGIILPEEVYNLSAAYRASRMTAEEFYQSIHTEQIAKDNLHWLLCDLAVLISPFQLAH